MELIGSMRHLNWIGHWPIDELEKMIENMKTNSTIWFGLESHDLHHYANYGNCLHCLHVLEEVQWINATLGAGKLVYKNSNAGNWSHRKKCIIINNQSIDV